jgi:hypothetical protein
MSAAWLLPIVPANVAAGSAGVLAAAHAAALGDQAIPHSAFLRSVMIIGARGAAGWRVSVRFVLPARCSSAPPPCGHGQAGFPSLKKVKQRHTRHVHVYVHAWTFTTPRSHLPRSTPGALLFSYGLFLSLSITAIYCAHI